MRAALEQIRAEIGHDAVILATRRVREGGWRTLFGLFGRPLVEVTVAWDGGPGHQPAAGGEEAAAPFPPHPRRPGVPSLSAPRRGTPAPGDPRRAATPAGGAVTAGRATPAHSVPAPGDGAQAPAGPATPRGVHLDVTVGREPLVPAPGRRGGRTTGQAAPAPATPAAARAGGTGSDRPAAAGGQGRGRASTAVLGSAVAGAGAAHGGLPPGLRLAGEPPLAGVVVAIGPTGAGKTTTLAKLAAHATLERGLQVALVAADTYRLAATAQLEAYAEVLGTELAVAYSAAEVGAHVERLRQRADLVLVDTAGRSYLLPEVVQEMARVVAAAAPDRVLLVVPAVLAAADAEGLARAVRGIGVTDLVVTKVDETVSPEALLARAAAWGWPLALIGCGQRVPEDLVWATAETVAAWLGGRAAGAAPVAGGGGGRGGAG